MSEQLSKLELENANLKKQLEQNRIGVENLLSNIDAYKGELADSRTISLQLRNNLVMLQKVNNELSDKVNALQKTVDDLNKPQAENGVCL